MMDYIEKLISYYSNVVVNLGIALMLFCIVLVYGLVKRKWRSIIALLFIIPLIYMIVYYATLLVNLRSDKIDINILSVEGIIEDRSGSHIDKTIFVNGIKLKLSRINNYDIDVGESFMIKYLEKSRYIVDAKEIIE